MKKGYGAQFGRLVAVGVCTLACFAQSAMADLASAGVDLGATQQFALFSLERGNVVTRLFGNAEIGGGTFFPGVNDVGISGVGRVYLQDAAIIRGDLYYHTPGQLVLGGNATVQGSTFNNTATDALLNQATRDAVQASAQAFALPRSSFTPRNIITNRSLTLNGNGTVVLKLTDFVLRGGASLTLQGDADTNFIINVSRRFILTNSSVLLSGGVTQENVLFNVRGGGAAYLTGGSILNGKLLAINRSVGIGGVSSVHGQVIANRVVIGGPAPSISR